MHNLNVIAEVVVLQVEETTLESLVWRSDSPVWEAVKQSGDVPSVEEVSEAVCRLCVAFKVTSVGQDLWLGS